MMTPPLTIVIPAFNEAGRLGASLRTVLDYLGETAPGGELIVVDDGSTDDTAAVGERT